MNYFEAGAWLDSIRAKDASTYQSGTQNIVHLLAALGNPQLSFKSIHVAGTSGKGSTCTFISSILSASGLKVGLAVSPHVEKINERIQISNLSIDDDQFAKLVTEIHPIWEKVASSGYCASFFEVITSMAFLHFAREKVDYAVIETGMGGLLDATNVLQPVATVITPISLDHQNSLGNTVEKIARHKAGIIKQKTPVIASCSGPALGVIQKTALEKQAPLLILGRDFSFQVTKNDLTGCYFDFNSPKIQVSGLHSNLLGKHQALNASTALATCSLLEEITEENALIGIERAFLPCRLEIISRNPFVLIDGAHNEEKANVTANFLKSTFEPSELELIIGIVNYKDPIPILAELATTCSKIHFVAPPHLKKFHDPHKLVEKLKETYPSLPAVAISLDQISFILSEKKATCITGSLYLAGEVKTLLNQKQPALIEN